MMEMETQVTYHTETYMSSTEPYMAQEDDWDRDLLLDPAWEKQQRKVKLLSRLTDKLSECHSTI